MNRMHDAEHAARAAQEAEALTLKMFQSLEREAAAQVCRAAHARTAKTNA